MHLSASEDRGRNKDDAAWATKNIGNRTLDQWVLRGIRDDYIHFEPMWKYVFQITPQGQHRMDVDELFCQEKFSEATDWVNSNFGDIFPADDIPHANRGSHSSGGDQHQLSLETRQVIEELYALDYCVFSYRKAPTAARQLSVRQGANPNDILRTAWPNVQATRQQHTNKTLRLLRAKPCPNWRAYCERNHVLIGEPSSGKKFPLPANGIRHV